MTIASEEAVRLRREGMALRLPPRGAGLRCRGAGEPGYTSMLSAVALQRSATAPDYPVTGTSVAVLVTRNS